MPLTPANLTADTVHPFAAIFPMIADDELAVLAADIKQNGLRDPIAIDESARIVDGRNRFAACLRAKVEPKFTAIKGTDAEIAAFIISRNVHRRHLTTGQRAMATALVLKSLGKRRNGRWARGSIPAIPDIGNSAWHNAMTQAGVVADAEDFDLVKAVVNGDTYLHVAVDLLNPAPSKPIKRVVRTPAPEEARDREQERLEAATSQLEDGVEELEERTDELLGDVLNDIAADIAPTIGAKAPASKARRGDDLNPVQREEQRAARDSAQQENLAKASSLGDRLDVIDAQLHDKDLYELNGKPVKELIAALERFAATIDWALSRLRHEEGE